MRLLHVLAEDTIGGTELHVVTLAEGLRDEVMGEVATLFEPGPVRAQLQRSDVPVFSLGGTAWPVRARRLASLIRSRRYDIVAAYGIKASLLARFAVRTAHPSPAFVCGVQGLHVTETIDAGAPKARLALALELVTTGLVREYDVNSRGAADLLASAGVDRKRLHYIPNGVDTDTWQPGPVPLRDREPVIVCAARLVGRKRQADLIEAVAALRAAGLPALLKLLGDGPDREALKAHVDALGIDDAVELVGPCTPEQVRQYLAGAVVFALPSDWEGMPAAVLEAMSAGLAVVASDVNGTRDVIEHNVTGRLFEVRDMMGLTGQLRATLEDRVAAERLGAAARRHVTLHGSLGSMLDAKLALYRLAVTE